jgi:hypothetical protein
MLSVRTTSPMSVLKSELTGVSNPFVVMLVLAALAVVVTCEFDSRFAVGAVVI